MIETRIREESITDINLLISRKVRRHRRFSLGVASAELKGAIGTPDDRMEASRGTLSARERIVVRGIVVDSYTSRVRVLL